MTRIVSIHAQRRGFRHQFRVALLGVNPSRPETEDSVYVGEEDLYNYHRFQLAGLTQLGRLCRFPLEDEAQTPHQLQMLWNRELAAAAWSKGGETSPNVQADVDTLQNRAAAADRLRLAAPYEEEDDDLTARKPDR